MWQLLIFWQILLKSASKFLHFSRLFNDRFCLSARSGPATARQIEMHALGHLSKKKKASAMAV